MSKAMKSIRGTVSFLLLAVLISFGISPAATANGGDIWTSQTSAADNSWYGVTYGNGLFVAVSYTGTGNRVMTSPDGITWTSRTSAADNDWFGVTYGNGLFVAVAASGTGNRVMTAPSTIVPVYVPPMLPSFAPSISLNNGVITCTIGEYSRAATSVAFSLFVDGTHVSTNFSSTGDYLPDWIIPWATSATITRTATLTSASWNIGLAGNGKKATCSTLAYSNHATGLISSNSISLP